VIPSSFRIARHLLSRLENAETGEIIPREFHIPIPDERRFQAAQAAAALGTALKSQLPLWSGTRTVVSDPTELLLNRTWRPQASVIGLDGLPGIESAAAVMHPATALKISLRLPPTLNAQAAGQRLKLLLEDDPPYGCEATFHLDLVSQGWHASPLSPWLARSVETASRHTFAQSSALFGGGGGIPFVAMLGQRFPDAQFLVTGVLGPHSNAHGPNEFLHVPTAKRLTAAIAQVLHDASNASRASQHPSAGGGTSCGIDDTVRALTPSVLCESHL
jgi:acetylornithine deacetylase/succinyl-diaminopimelate desuccinylase-like protein